MTGKLTGIGIGPGSPDLLTVRAVRAIRDAQTVFVPRGKNGKPGVALTTAQDYIPETAQVIEMDFPMVSISGEAQMLDEQWRDNADTVKNALEKGDGVFLTLGDPMVYSTYSYIIDFLAEQGINTENIPGITSFCALASLLGIPLAQGEESLAVVSMTQDDDEIRAILRLNKNIIVMKASGRNEFLADLLEEEGLEKQFTRVSNIGMPSETISSDIDELRGRIPYFSTILIKKDYDFKN
ncbi:MAG: precorrin-2 C(20)-methyltransferase [Eubacteriaceae bacterium]|jgi:precorrin-2/cobalt-factor-2 C20-methyltransferase